ncbi:DUF1919 domain-containing protein [Thalassobellus citreus]|uniref:DUF1919 domain-containing protein n=1 Tax=Thalassobellus citreus TaxID=3367752 RepID=UPI0037B0BBE2
MIRQIEVFIKRKIRHAFRSIFCKKDIKLLRDKKFVIISNNCWGGALYQWYNRPYNSPFIGLFIYGPCYLRMLSNFEYYLKQELKFVPVSKYPDRIKNYPVALLDDIEIHFTHFDNEQEANDKWNRRRTRMLAEKNLDNYFFKICDRERVTIDCIQAFHKLPFKNKISFALDSNPELEKENHIKVFESHKNNKKFVPNGKKMFKITFIYFNLNKWLAN